MISTVLARLLASCIVATFALLIMLAGLLLWPVSLTIRGARWLRARVV